MPSKVERLQPVPVPNKAWNRLIVEAVGSDGETYSFEASIVNNEHPEVIEKLWSTLETALEGQLREMGLWAE